ncbi:MAG TPA: hypothetical protein VFS00_08340 [Polyangiaceae bacterium]|nr:hypothetical protein [Polyangiaceae bacterium]
MNRWYDNPWPEYVPAAQRERSAKQSIAMLTKQGKAPSPVVIAGRAIATTFWGKGWCEHLERFSDHENRLPRGRTYVRSGAVVDLQIGPGRIDARVRGTSLYHVSILIEPLAPARWREIAHACAGKIGSLVSLLRGRFDAAVMQIVGRASGGLFPEPAQITLACSCPDWATMCKHIAAVLYGVGARLDARPELLFTLRQVDPADLVASAPSPLSTVAQRSPGRHLDADSLADVFGIDLDGAGAPTSPAKAASGAKAAPATKASAAAKAAPAEKASTAAKQATPRAKAAPKAAAATPKAAVARAVAPAGKAKSRPATNAGSGDRKAPAATAAAGQPAAGTPGRPARGAGRKRPKP